MKLILNLIERGHLVIKSSTSFNVLPMSLEEIFRLEFNLRFPSYKSFERVQEILAISSAALYPMTLIELFQTVNALRLSKVSSPDSRKIKKCKYSIVFFL